MDKKEMEQNIENALARLLFRDPEKHKHLLYADETLPEKEQLILTKEDIENKIVCNIFCAVCGEYFKAKHELIVLCRIKYNKKEAGQFYIRSSGCPFCNRRLAFISPVKMNIPEGKEE